jgi:poly(hydroxyalkanoate) granule-associated protein
MEDITLKKLLLAGIGTMAYTYEKGAEMVEELIQKGEITISQGREINQELKRKSTEAKAENPPVGKKHEPEAEHEGAVWEMLRDVLSGMDIATKEDINKLEERIKRLENR